MSNIQIESDLKEILNKLDQKLDNIDKKFEQKLDYIDQKFEQKLDNIDKKFEQKLDHIDQKFEQKFDHLQKDVTDINLRLTKVETKLDNTVEDIKEIKGSQKAQIWTLIGVLITAIGGFLVAVGRSVLSFNP